jgi:hypothetical protein
VAERNGNGPKAGIRVGDLVSPQSGQPPRLLPSAPDCEIITVPNQADRHIQLEGQL